MQRQLLCTCSSEWKPWCCFVSHVNVKEEFCSSSNMSLNKLPSLKVTRITVCGVKSANPYLCLFFISFCMTYLCYESPPWGQTNYLLLHYNCMIQHDSMVQLDLVSFSFPLEKQNTAVHWSERTVTTGHPVQTHHFKKTPSTGTDFRQENKRAYKEVLFIQSMGRTCYWKKHLNAVFQMTRIHHLIHGKPIFAIMQ